ncbi:plasminogen-like, partial [Bolinopsis microptera]|uniref:plasminogen-like n=1 Tax=Bolinopsis microptera TaxID=2820187 RepID=UPI003078F75C
VVVCAVFAEEQQCPRGTYLVFGECHLCPKGSYQPGNGGRSHCIRCPRGTYASVRGSFECTPCPDNHFTYFDSSESPDACVGPMLVVTIDGEETENTADVDLKELKETATLELTPEISLPAPLTPSDISSASPVITNDFCYTGTGHDYKGRANMSEYLVECLNWDDVTSMPDYNPGHNFCRKFGSHSKRPYCFISGDMEPRLVPCTVPKCIWDEECSGTPSGEEYLGPVDTTDSLYKCQNWSKDYPHPHGYNDVGDHNKCRNPGGSEEKPWCYTEALTFPVWDYCSIRDCVAGNFKRYNFSRDH